MSWEYFAPPIDAGARWLSELRAMRGHVFYDGGRRPEFGSGGAARSDDDPRDLDGHHILCRRDGELHGCIRLHRELEEQVSPVVAHVGRIGLVEFLCGRGVTAGSVSEVSRLAVLRGARASGLGFRLVAGVWALARALGSAHVLALVGTKQRQDEFLVSMGARELRFVRRRTSVLWDDELCVLHFDLAAPSEVVRPLVDQMAKVLDECRGNPG